VRFGHGQSLSGRGRSNSYYGPSREVLPPRHQRIEPLLSFYPIPPWPTIRLRLSSAGRSTRCMHDMMQILDRPSTTRAPPQEALLPAVTHGEMRRRRETKSGTQGGETCGETTSALQPNPGGVAIPPNQLILEAKQLRSDSSRPEDMYAIAGYIHAKDAAMNVVLCSTLSVSCLLKSSTSSDFALSQAESNKFRKNLRFRKPLQLSATQRFIPLAMNECGRKRPHYSAILREIASLMITRPVECRMLQGPFLLPPTVAMAKLLSTCGARLSWAAR